MRTSVPFIRPAAVRRAGQWGDSRSAAVAAVAGRLLLSAGLAYGTVAMAPARAGQSDCGIAGVTIRSEMPSGTEIVCAGVVDAFEFFRRLGIDATATIRLDIVPVLPEPASPGAIGIYLKEEDRSYLLGFAEVKRRGALFGLPPRPGLYRSLVTHETAHAISATLFQTPKPRIEAQEYISYVAMLVMMDDADRAALAALYPDESFSVDSHINTMIYLFDPIRFGVLSYRHYLRPENGPAFIRRILAGKALNTDYGL